MKIWIAVHHFPPNYMGGAEWRACRTAKAIQNHGDEVKVICVEHIDRPHEHNLSWIDDIYEGIPVRRIDMNLAKAGQPFPMIYDNHWISEAMNEWMRGDKPDLLHLISGYLMTASPLQLAFQQHIPTVVSLTDFWFLCPRINMVRTDGKVASIPIRPEECVRCLAEEKRRYRWLGKMLPGVMAYYWNKQTRNIDQVRERLNYLVETLNQVDLIISPSEFLRKVYIQSGVNPQKILFLRQGVDLSGVTPIVKQTKPTTLRIGYLGQIAPHKGVHLLLEAIRKHPDLDVEVKIYGKTSQFPQYTADLTRLADHDRRIKMMGTYQGPLQLRSVMSELDCVAVPSVWYENSPNSILESFAYHTPVIGSNFGGMAELIKHRMNGLLFKLGDSNDLALQIKSLIDEPDLLQHLREGIEPVKEITTEMAEILEIYRERFAAVQSRPLFGQLNN